MLWIWSTEILFTNFQFSLHIYSTWQILGGGQCRKACRSRKKESKESEITWKQSEPVRSIFKIEKRREFVRALCNEQCPKNSFKNLKGLLGLVEKASFSREFRSEFHSGGGGNGAIPKLNFLVSASPSWCRPFLYLGCLTFAPATNFARKRVKTRYLTLLCNEKLCGNL